ncbi:pitrilysin family protein [Desulfonatronum sp. SC1]|uniref:M16 family metallopeptidase n=1 Tax=Desulfonatronum sp. SC1 TaxID=2109626 RepID=UPI000D3086BB|nr:pitrilysin family protein [Desulfonatronum sp. SC1]PTN33497.1 peptidase M16 [Desulfonatronum sp. SC1]
MNHLTTNPALHSSVGLHALALLLLLGLLCGPTPPARAADFETWTTSNGLRVLFAPAPTLPMLDIRLVFDAGSARDGDHGGLARMTNLALAFGTSDLDADTVAERFESVGAQFSASAARDMAIVRLRTLTEPDWMEVALATFVSLLADPAFPEDDLARARRQALQALQRDRQEPGAMASREFYRLAYGDHPYAVHPLGTEQSVPTLEGPLVRVFFQRHYTAQNAVLALTGDLSMNAAQALSQRIGAALPQGERPAALPSPEIPSEPIMKHIPFPSEQAHIVMGGPLLRLDDPDRFPLSVANHVFGGGGFTSRLFQDVRTERGLAYSVSSHIQPMAAEGPFLITMQTGVHQAADALTVLRDALAAFISEGVTEEELAASKDNIIGRFPLGLASNSDIAATLGMIGFYDLAPDYLTTYTDHVARVTREDAGDALARRLAMDRMVTVVVGGPAGILDALQDEHPDDRSGTPFVER